MTQMNMPPSPQLPPEYLRMLELARQMQGQNQMPPGQMPPGQMPPGQMPQVPPGQAPAAHPGIMQMIMQMLGMGGR